MKQNLLTIWAKRAVPALALAMMVLPACDKEPDVKQKPEQIQQHDEVIYYYYNNNNNLRYSPDTVNKYVADKSVRHIYRDSTGCRFFNPNI